MRPRQSAALGGGSGALSRSVLVLGYGNTLRRDDGAGAVAARLLAADPRLQRDGVEVREAYQLLPEMSLDFAAVSLVVLVDADAAGLPGSIEVHEIDPTTAARDDADARGEPGASSHHVGGGELVALAATLGGRAPAAVAIGIGVADLEMGEGLSPAVEAALPRVLEIVADLVERHLAAE
ncbi:MAG: hydrogenase maturation protease [Candidatus Limnocylindrales bacterium]